MFAFGMVANILPLYNRTEKGKNMARITSLHRHIRGTDIDLSELEGSEYKFEVQKLDANPFSYELSYFELPSILIGVRNFSSCIHEEGIMPVGQSVLNFIHSKNQFILRNRSYTSSTLSSTLSGTRSGMEFQQISHPNLEHIFIIFKEDALFNSITDEDVKNILRLTEESLTGIQIPSYATENIAKILHQLISIANPSNSVQFDNSQAIKDIESTILQFILNDIISYSHTLPIRKNARSKILYKALNVIDSISDLPLTVTQISSEISVSVRTLEKAFTELLGLTPKTYLKIRRLNQIRRDIRHQANKSITNIASRYGVIHMGNFSKSYKELFGESPSETRTNK